MKLSNLRKAYQHGLLRQRVLDRINKSGVRIEPYVLYVEGDFRTDPAWVARYSDYDVGPIDPAYLPAVAAQETWTTEDRIRERLTKGQVCIAVTREGELAAYTWADLEQCNHAPCVFSLERDEAYLYGAHTLEAFRGRGLAPYMRAACYDVLREIGRTRFYSVTDYFNTPSIRFKQKLNAYPSKLYVHVRTGKGWSRNWLLRSYPEPAHHEVEP